MDLFKDKKREGFDELTQLIEPFIYEYNSVVSRLPEQLEFSLKDLLQITKGSFSGYVGTNQAVSLAFIQAGIKDDDLSYTTRQQLRRDTYKFEVHGNVEIDMSVPEMRGGSITATKTATVKNDEQIMEQMIRGISDNMFSYANKAANCPSARFHELAESFGFYDEMRKQTTFKGRKRLLKEKVLDQIKDNTIRIRDFELGLRFGKWINAFITQGNLAALKNIATLKIMSYNDEAIYSIDEEEI